MRHLSLLLLAFLLLGGCEQQTSPSRVVVTAPMTMSSLDRERALRIYLPPGYDSSERRYPVLYMHDAQNLFDDATAYAGEWQVDETLDRMAAAGGPELIVVGIDNGAELRLYEMAPWPHAEYGEPQADGYLDFIVEQVKPWVDSQFRTKPGLASTGIMGSSMGGLVSHYAAFRHPDVFSKIGVFSPSYWWSEQVFELDQHYKISPNSRFYLIVGESEDVTMVSAAKAMFDELRELNIDVSFHPISNGEHNEALWRSEFAAAVSWLFGEGTQANALVKD